MVNEPGCTLNTGVIGKGVELRMLLLLQYLDNAPVSFFQLGDAFRMEASSARRNLIRACDEVDRYLRKEFVQWHRDDMHRQETAKTY